jgi:hypothetical protein
MSNFIHAITIGLLIGVLGFGFNELTDHHPRLTIVVGVAMLLSAFALIIKYGKNVK